MKNNQKFKREEMKINH